MKLTYEQIKNITTGCERITTNQGGLLFHRFCESQENLYKKTSDYPLLLSPSGVKMRFKTNSKKLFIKGFCERVSPVRSFWAVDVIKNGVFLDSIKNFDNSISNEIYAEKDFFFGNFEQEFYLGDGINTIEIHLPYSAKTILFDIELDNNSSLQPIKRKKTLLAFGDSITQGFDALHSSERYISKLADFLNAEEYNRAIGGARFYPPLALKECSKAPDFVTVAYGTNDFYCDSKQKFEENCEKFFNILSEKYPLSKIFALAPLRRLNATPNTDFGEFENLGKIIEFKAKKFENISFIDCFSFLPDEKSCFADGFLHPNDKGFKLYSNSLISRIKSIAHQETE